VVLRPTPPPDACRDDNDSCAEWAFFGGEGRSWFLVSDEGAVTNACRSPQTTYTNTTHLTHATHATTSLTHHTTECDKNPKYMLVSCRLACKLCAPDNLAPAPLKEA
jgi:hypothetical protein